MERQETYLRVQEALSAEACPFCKIVSRRIDLDFKEIKAG